MEVQGQRRANNYSHSIGEPDLDITGRNPSNQQRMGNGGLRGEGIYQSQPQLRK